MSDPTDEDGADAERGVVRVAADDEGNDSVWIRKLVPRLAHVDGETTHRVTSPESEDLPPPIEPTPP